MKTKDMQMDEYSFDNEIELLQSYITSLENKIYYLEDANERLKKEKEEMAASIRVLTTLHKGGL